MPSPAKKLGHTKLSKRGNFRTTTTAENGKFIARLVEQGLSVSGALRLAGVDHTVHSRAMRKAENLLKDGQELPYDLEVYHHHISRALGSFEKKLVTKVVNSDDPRVALDTLGRRFSPEWGQNNKVSLGADISSMTSDEALQAMCLRVEMSDINHPARRQLFNQLLADYGPQPVQILPTPERPGLIKVGDGRGSYYVPAQDAEFYEDEVDEDLQNSEDPLDRILAQNLARRG